MKFIKDITEDEMILAFLKAEAVSPRFDKSYKKIFNTHGATLDIIFNADLNSEWENMVRKQILDHVRGNLRGILLFEKFPKNVQWKKYTITPEELKKIKYAKFIPWNILTNGTRKAIDGAKNIDVIETTDNTNDNVRRVAQTLTEGTKYPEIILVTESEDGELLLFEGYTRTTAYLYNPKYLPEELEVIVGISKDLPQWVWY